MQIIYCKDFHPTKPINATSIAAVPLFPSSHWWITSHHLWANNGSLLE